MEVPVLRNPGSKEIWTCLLLVAPGGTLLLIPVSVKSWKASLVHGGIRGITKDGGSVQAHDQQRDPAESSQFSHVMSRYMCPVTACTAQRSGEIVHMGSSSLFFPHDLFQRALLGQIILNHLQIMFFSLPRWLARDFVSFRSRCWGSCIESILASSSQCNWGHCSGLWIPTQISRNCRSPSQLWDTKAWSPKAVPKQQISSEQPSASQGGQAGLVC